LFFLVTSTANAVPFAGWVDSIYEPMSIIMTDTRFTKISIRKW